MDRFRSLGLLASGRSSRLGPGGWFYAEACGKDDLVPGGGEAWFPAKVQNS